MRIRDSLLCLAVLFGAGLLPVLFVHPNSSWLPVAFAVGATLLGAPAVVAHLRARAVSASAWTYMHRVPKTVVAVVAGALVLQLVMATIDVWRHGFGVARADVAAWSQAIVAGALLPIAEEIALRVVLLGQLLAWRVPPAAAALLQGGAFGLFHAGIGLYGMALLGICGFAYGLITLRAGAIWPAIVLHIGWNAIELARHGARGGSPQVGSSLDIPLDLLLPHAVSALGLLALSLWLWRNARHRGPQTAAARLATRPAAPRL